MSTLHEYIMSVVESENELMDEVKSVPSWYDQNGNLLNYHYGPIGNKEREAMKSLVDLDLLAAQEALKREGEVALTPAEAKKLWQVRYERRLFEDDVVKAVGFVKKREEAIAKHPYPNLYKQSILDSKVEDIIESWKPKASSFITKAGRCGRE